MSRNIDDLRRAFRPKARQLIQDTRSSGFEVVPYFTLRTPLEQAKLWRMTRGKSEIGRKMQYLYDEGALYIANCLEAVGKCYPGPGITGHVTRAVPGESWHNWGEAMDVYLKIDDAIEWDGDHEGYAAYGTNAEDLGLTWGGMWNDPDPGHVQGPPMKVVDYMGDIQRVSAALERKFGGLL